MCTGTEMAWITAALTASSAAAKYAGDKKSQAAMESMRALERDRQERMQKESAALLNESTDTAGAAKAEQDISDAAMKRQEAYAAANAVPEPAQATAERQLGVSGQNRVIGGNVASERAKADAYNAVLNSGLARLGGFTDRTLANNIANNRFLNQQANIGNFMQGSLGVLPLELEAANRKGDNMRMLGDILGTAGTVTGMMAATGINPFASGADAASKGAAATIANAPTVNVPAGTINLSAPSTQAQLIESLSRPATDIASSLGLASDSGYQIGNTLFLGPRPSNIPGLTLGGSNLQTYAPRLIR